MDTPRFKVGDIVIIAKPAEENSWWYGEDNVGDARHYLVGDRIQIGAITEYMGQVAYDHLRHLGEEYREPLFSGCFILESDLKPSTVIKKRIL